MRERKRVLQIKSSGGNYIGERIFRGSNKYVVEDILSEDTILAKEEPCEEVLRLELTGFDTSYTSKLTSNDIRDLITKIITDKKEFHISKCSSSTFLILK